VVIQNNSRTVYTSQKVELYFITEKKVKYKKKIIQII